MDPIIIYIVYQSMLQSIPTNSNITQWRRIPSPQCSGIRYRSLLEIAPGKSVPLRGFDYYVVVNIVVFIILLMLFFCPNGYWRFKIVLLSNRKYVPWSHTILPHSVSQSDTKTRRTRFCNKLSAFSKFLSLSIKFYKCLILLLNNQIPVTG